MRARIGICVAAAVSAFVAGVAPIGGPGAGIAGAAGGKAKPAATISAVPMHSSYETPTRIVSCDIGISVPLPDGHAIWLFGDTSIYTTNPKGAFVNTGFVDGSTALESKYARGQIPHGGEYPSGQPTRFLPVPLGVYLPDGSGRRCIKGTGKAAFSACWPIGAAVMPSNTSQVLITYSEVCITVPPQGGPAIRVEGWGYLLYNWRQHKIALGPIDVFKPQRNGAPLAPSHNFGWPVFVNGHVTLFSSSCTAQYLNCGGGRVWSVTPSALSNPNAYRPVQMSTDGSAKWKPLTISVGQYPEGLRMVEMTSIGGQYEIFAAPTIGARWKLMHSGTLPDCTPTGTNYCHGVESHPELSTPTRMFISYKDPNSGPGGHMVISAIPY